MRDYTIVSRHEDLGRVANLVAAAQILGLDIETYKTRSDATWFAGSVEGAFDPRKGEIRLVQLNVDDKSIWVIDLMRTGGLGPMLDAFRASKAKYVIHNAKFEQKWFWHKFDLELWPVFCTFRASALIHNGKLGTKHDLNTVVVRELGDRIETDDVGASDWSKPNLTKMQLDYAAEDVVRLPRLREKLKGRLAEDGLLQTALIEFGVCLSEGDCELRGFPVNRQAWDTLARAKIARRRQLKEELLGELPHPHDQLALPGMVGSGAAPPLKGKLKAGSWIDSPADVLESLHKLKLTTEDEMGRTILIPDTSALTLAAHAKLPQVAKLLDYRHVGQRVKTFGLDFLKWVEADGRVHTSYWALLVSGRYSSAKPNLQQIPRDPDYRACFECLPGRVFVIADYAGIEMRIVAEIANDGRLIQVFVDNEDAHYATASLVLRKPKEKISKAERQQAKAVNFGFIYGMQPKKFVIYALANYGVGLSLKQAEGFHKRYFENYQGIARWHSKVTSEGQRRGYSRTLSGRIRYMDPKAWNEYMNNPVQGTGADALKLSMRAVHERLRHPQYGGRAWLVHHVHDELIVECDDNPEMIAAVKQDLEQGMKEGMAPFLKKVPVVVEANHGRSWAAAK